jgi:D-aspartate ligase
VSDFKDLNGAIILGGHVQSLGITRILGREGIPVIVIDKTKANLAKHSKYSCDFFCVKDDCLLEFLYGLIQKKQYRKWVIFPTDDFHVNLLSQNKQELETNFIVSTDSWESVSIFYNKRKSYEVAKNFNIPIASTFFPENEKELDKLIIDYPCIIKPAIMHVFYKQVKKKVFVCRNLIELKANYNKALNLIPADEVIVQEIIKGSGKNQFSACFLFLKGETYVYLAACRMRQHPLDFGNATTYAETTEIPLLKEYGERILKAADYNGLCEVEFKFDDRDKQYKFLEVNPRTWKWHSIANKTGTPFIKNYYDYLNGKSIQRVEQFSKASFLHLLTDLPLRLLLFLKGYSYWNRILKPVEHAVWAKDDIMPWFYEKLYLLFFIFIR